MAIYGIDLGTTFCSAAYLDAGAHPHVVPLDRGQSTLASIVLLAPPAIARSGVTVGRLATMRYRSLRAGHDVGAGEISLIRASKNFMGVRESLVGGPPWRLGAHSLFATDVAAILLRTLAEQIRRNPRLPSIEAVVVTHPQRFRNSEKLATAQAVRLAGLELAGLITEPDAAAWSYGLHERATGSGMFMVFDFGGGTLDVAVMHRTTDGTDGPTMRAVASYGVQLGGLQIDERIRDGLVEKYRRASGEHSLDLANVTEATRDRFLDLAEALKVDLNRDAAADPAPMLRARARAFRTVDAEGREGSETRLKVTLGEMSQWISGEMDRAVACADEAVARAGVRWNDIQEVLLTGGSSQLLALQQRMRERCANRVQVVFEEQDHPLRPSTIVAVGAALYGAAMRARARGERTRMEVRGVVPDAFSVRAFAPDSAQQLGRRAVLHTLVEAGTPTPHVGHARFTMRGGGRVLPVEIFEGRTEDEATSIGTFRLEFDREVPDGAAVEVQLRIEANGALVLAICDSERGTTPTAILCDAPGLFSEAELDERRQWLQTQPLAFDTSDTSDTADTHAQRPTGNRR